MSIAAAAEQHRLFVMGTLHPRAHYGPEHPVGTLFLIGTNAEFWPIFEVSNEYLDRAADPLDRWSKRILPTLTDDPKATFFYPSDGPPYAPFIDWSLKSGTFHPSPTGMMVHVVAGLMISIRGAICFPDERELTENATENPCEGCVNRPCVTRCPVGALNDHSFYDVPACKDFLRSTKGRDCMTQGCSARLACPISQSFARPAAQSQFHMKAFL